MPMVIDTHRNIGFLTLGIYLILTGVTAFAPGLHIPSIALSVIAIISGIFILLGR